MRAFSTRVDLKRTIPESFKAPVILHPTGCKHLERPGYRLWINSVLRIRWPVGRLTSVFSRWFGGSPWIQDPRFWLRQKRRIRGFWAYVVVFCEKGWGSAVAKSGMTLCCRSSACIPRNEISSLPKTTCQNVTLYFAKDLITSKSNVTLSHYVTLFLALSS